MVIVDVEVWVGAWPALACRLWTVRVPAMALVICPPEERMGPVRGGPDGSFADCLAAATDLIKRYAGWLWEGSEDEDGE